jgi:hypothetical protein
MMDSRTENDEISIQYVHFSPVPMRMSKDFYMNCPSMEQDMEDSSTVLQ